MRGASGLSVSRAFAVAAVVAASAGCRKRPQLPVEQPRQEVPSRFPTEADVVITPVQRYSDEVEAEIEAVISDLREPGALVGELGPPKSLQDRMDFFDVPGVSIAVIDGYAIAWARGFGLRRDGDDTPVDVRTLFEAGSISKPVFATGVMRLRDAGKLDLDRDVNHDLRSWTLPPSAGWQPTVTLRHLLTHSAGTTVHGFPGYGPHDELPSVPAILDGEPPANTPAVRVDAVPGLQPRYSGGGYTIAQLVVTDAIGGDFVEIMRTWALDPMGMEYSTFAQPLPKVLTSYAATGHAFQRRPVRGGFSAYPEMAAAGLWSTPTELARFVLGLMLSYRGDENAPLPAETAHEILSPQTAPEVGLGLFFAGEPLRFEHGGADAGFEAFLVGYVEGGQGAVVMTNANGAQALIAEILGAIARQYEWPGYHQGPPTQIADVAPKVLARYAGRYEVRPDYVVAVDAEQGGLAVTFPGQHPLRFQPTSDTELFTNALDVTIAFEVDAKGRPLALTIDQGRGPVRAVRLSQ